MTSHTSARLPGRSAVLALALCAASAATTVAGAAPADTPSGSNQAAAGGLLGNVQLDWARDALGRNAMLEVVSMDPATGIITVRVKRTGELRRVRADEVIAELPPDASGGSPATPAAAPGERVIASGPGYSIAAAGPARGAAAEAAAPAADTAAEDSGPARNLPVEHRHDPIICQGARLLQIDNRNLVFDGNAVSAEQGCELHITNSLITAKGIGVAASGASVHIENSVISGESGSVQASDGAQVYARSSTFKGLIRRNDTAAFHDLGGNVGD